MSPSNAAVEAKRVLELVERPDPQKAFDSFPHQLSGGPRQRAMIAQSLSCDPTLLIANEPTTALDVTVQAEILELMRHLKDGLDSASILITHDMGVVADLTDRIVVMRRGRIVEQGPARAIFLRAPSVHPRAPRRRPAPRPAGGWTGGPRRVHRRCTPQGGAHRHHPCRRDGRARGRRRLGRPDRPRARGRRHRLPEAGQTARLPGRRGGDSGHPPGRDRRTRP